MNSDPKTPSDAPTPSSSPVPDQPSETAHKSRTIPVLIASLGVAVLAFLLWPNSPGASAQPGSRKVSFYQDSMHPWVKSDKPGKCTVCGMDLTAIYEGQAGFGSAANSVVLNSNNVTVLNVQTAEVKPRAIGRTLQVAGTFEADETKKTIVAAPAAGRIDALKVRYAGVDVREGESLVTFYSPELTLEKRRFLVRASKSVQRDPTGGLAMPMTDNDPYYSELISPQSGTIVERRVYKGQYVSDGERLFTIVDLSVLWFRFDVYEHQLPWLVIGQSIDVTVPALPGRVFTAKVSFIEPMLNEPTRTFKVRAELLNPILDINGRKQRLLGLGMYAQGDLRAKLDDALAVPRSAILFLGSSAYAYVDKGNGAYEKRRVKLGHEGDNLWEVVKGLDKGERVVVSGNVLIDAQAQFIHNPKPDEMGMDMDESADHTVIRVPAPVTTIPIALPEDLDAGQMHMTDATPPEEKQTPAPPERMAVKTPVAPPMGNSSTNLIKPAWHPRGPAHTNIPPGLGFRSNRLGAHDVAMEATFSRAADARNAELAEIRAAAALNTAKYTPVQCQKLKTVITAADGVSQALAADSFEDFKKRTGELTVALAPLENEFDRTNPLGELVQHLSKASKFPEPKNLDDARTQFVPLGAAITDLSKEIKKTDPSFAGLKIYHCPMAPKPGLWIQAKGPLHNPFYGSKMLECGEEVTE